MPGYHTLIGIQTTANFFFCCCFVRVLRSSPSRHRGKRTPRRVLANAEPKTFFILCRLLEQFRTTGLLPSSCRYVHKTPARRLTARQRPSQVWRPLHPNPSFTRLPTGLESVLPTKKASLYLSLALCLFQTVSKAFRLIDFLRIHLLARALRWQVSRNHDEEFTK